MEIELNSKEPRAVRCRLEKNWVWDELEVDGRGEEGGEQQQQQQQQHDGPAAASAAAGVEMDERMWSKLPAHLLEGHILMRLPLPSVFRFRSVCSSWNRLIFSDEFLERYYELSSSVPSDDHALLFLPPPPSKRPRTFVWRRHSPPRRLPPPPPPPSLLFGRLHRPIRRPAALSISPRRAGSALAGHSAGN